MALCQGKSTAPRIATNIEIAVQLPNMSANASYGAAVMLVALLLATCRVIIVRSAQLLTSEKQKRKARRKLEHAAQCLRSRGGQGRTARSCHVAL